MSAEPVEAQLERLAFLDGPGLKWRWRMRFGRSAPEHLSRALMQRVLAYRTQADALGDLDASTVKLFDRLGRGEIADIPMPERRRRSGTLLVREWEGTLQRVMVLDKGFAWNGMTACRRWPRPSPAPTGTARASLGCASG